MMPVFYGLYVGDEKLAAAFDLIRFFGEPNFVRRAHITVRGPYTERLPLEIERNWRGKHYQIHFSGPGSFFSVVQNTVFIKCDIPGIETVWNKPDYGGGITPHLTLYDGRDSGFGYKLFDMLKLNDWNFFVDATELMVIQAKAQPRHLNDLEIHQNLHNEILSRPINYRSVRTLDTSQRLVYISWVLRFLQEYIGQVHHGT
jgi:hypothetical protein